MCSLSMQKCDANLYVDVQVGALHNVLSIDAKM